jgi:class 3 adenylate cyclase
MMAYSYQSQIEKLRLSIEGLEAQRSLLGEAVVEPALAALREQLATLEKEAVLEEQAAPAEERRIVTILLFDMVGSTSLAEKLDPEEWRQVVAQFHTAVGQAVTLQHGEIAQYLGDGLLAFDEPWGAGSQRSRPGKRHPRRPGCPWNKIA